MTKGMVVRSQDPCDQWTQTQRVYPFLYSERWNAGNQESKCRREHIFWFQQCPWWMKI